MEEIVYGIDLGTTYSCLAYVNDKGEVVTVKDKTTQMPTVPSAILKNEKTNEIIVGRQAKNLGVAKPKFYADLFKRHMGEADPDDPGKTYQYTLGDEVYSPQELSRYVLEHLVKNANSILRDNGVITTDVKNVVITCPAYFSQAQREATKQAGILAGLNVLAIVEEPAAAAVNYVETVRQTEAKRILVYDLGGGTFDITLMQYSPKEEMQLERLSSGGNARLGGADWDKTIIDLFIDKVSQENGVARDELEKDLPFMQKLKNESEALKIALSGVTESEINLESRHIKDDDGTGSQTVELIREDFESMTSDLLEQTIALIDHMYSKEVYAGPDKKPCKLEQPDEILLVGGSTKMPQVLARLKKKYPTLKIVSPDPDEAVAKGAAIIAKKMLANGTVVKGKDDTGKPVDILGPGNGGIKDKAARSYGVRCTRGGKEIISNLIIANYSPTNIMVQKTYGTAQDYQTEADIQIYESNDSVENFEFTPEFEARRKPVTTATLKLSGKQPAGSPISIFCDISTGMLVVKGKDEATGVMVELEHVTIGVLSPEEMNEARRKSLKTK